MVLLSELTLHRSLSERLVVETEEAPRDTAATRLLPSNEHIGDCHELIRSVLPSVSTYNKDREAASTDPSPMESSSKKMIFSLSKFSKMSGFVVPALYISPQQPHFRPLLKREEELREGLACGLMMAFASLVTDLSNPCILDSKHDFEEKLKVLDYLEKHGFNTQPMRARLENLLKIRNLFGQLEEKKGKDNLLLSELEKSVVELEEWLKCVQGEITNLKACVQATEERTISVKLQFDAVVTAPW